MSVPVFVEIKGSITDLKAKLGEAETEIKGLSSKGAANVEKLSSVGKAAFLGLGGAALAFGTMAVKAAIEGEQAHAQLVQAVNNTGTAFQSVQGDVDALSQKFAKFGYQNDAVEQALTKITQETGSVQTGLKDMGLAADIAAGAHISLTDAAGMLGQVENGNVRSLRSLIGTTKDATGATLTAESAVKLLSERFGGAAQAQAQTFAGKVAALKAQFDNLEETIGNRLLPVLLDIGGAIADVANFFDHNAAAAAALGAVVAGPLAGAMAVYAAKQAAAVAGGLSEFLLSAAAAVPALEGGLLGAAASAETFGVAVDAALGPIGLLVGIAGAVGAAFVLAGHSAKSSAGDVASFTQQFQGSSVPTLQATSRELVNMATRIETTGGYIDELGRQTGRTTDAQKKNIEAAGRLREQAGALDDQVAKLNATQQAYGDLVQQAAPTIDTFAASLGITTEHAEALATKVGVDLVDAFTKGGDAQDKATEAVTKANDAARAASPAAADYAAQIAVLSSNTSTATERTNAFKQAMLDLTSPFEDARKAEINYQDKLDEISKSLKTNGKTLDDHTEKGRNNLKSVLDLVDGAQQQLAAYAAQPDGVAKATAAYGTLRADLVKSLQQFGLSKQAAEAYATQLFQIPANITTAVTVDPKQALDALSAIATKINNLPTRVVVTGAGRPQQQNATGGFIAPGETSSVDELGYEAKIVTAPAGGMQVLNHPTTVGLQRGVFAQPDPKPMVINIFANDITGAASGISKEMAWQAATRRG